MRQPASTQEKGLDGALELFSSGLPWIDAELGGFPRQGVVAATGAPGSGKTTFGLGLATSSLDRGARVCFLTNELPSAVFAVAERVYERDLRADVQSKSLSILTFAPFFVNKMKSLQSVEKPLAELGQLIAERGFEVVIFDTFDSMLGWADGADVKPVVALVLAKLRSWGVAVFCTLSESVDAGVELCHAADGSLALEPSRLVVREAKWCNVADLEVPINIVQGRGVVVTTTSRPPFEMMPSFDDMESAPRSVSTILPPSARAAPPAMGEPSAEDDARRAHSLQEPSPEPPSGAPSPPERSWVDLRQHAARTPSGVTAPRAVETVPPPGLPDSLVPPSFDPDFDAELFEPALAAPMPPTVPPPPRGATAPTVPPPPGVAIAPTVPPPPGVATVPPPAPTVPPPAPTVPPPHLASEPALKTGSRRIDARVLAGTPPPPSAATKWIRRR